MARNYFVIKWCGGGTGKVKAIIFDIVWQKDNELEHPTSQSRIYGLVRRSI